MASNEAAPRLFPPTCICNESLIWYSLCPLRLFCHGAFHSYHGGGLKITRDSAPFSLLTLCYSLSLPISHSLVLLSPPLLLFSTAISILSFSFTHSFSCFAPVLFLATPRIPPSSPPPSLPHFTLSFLLLHVRHHSLLLCIPSLI